MPRRHRCRCRCALPIGPRCPHPSPAISAARSSTPSFRTSSDTCRRTVTGAIWSRSAIAAVLCPRRSIPSTCDSRPVSASPPAPARSQLQQQLEHHRPRDHGLSRDDRVDDPAQVLAVERPGDIPDRSGAHRVEHVFDQAHIGEDHDRGVRRSAADAADRRHPAAGDVAADQTDLRLLPLRRSDRLLGVVGLGADRHGLSSAIWMPSRVAAWSAIITCTSPVMAAAPRARCRRCGAGARSGSHRAPRRALACSAGRIPPGSQRRASSESPARRRGRSGIPLR